MTMMDKAVAAVDAELDRMDVIWDDADAYRIAAAVLEAIREPDKAMLDAAAKAMSPGKRPTAEWVSCAEKHRIRFKAMIDAALAQSTGGADAG